MMNVLEIQNDLKNFSEEQLIKEMQQPSGSAPQFLVLSELNRRKRVKGEFEARQAKNMPTVAEEAVSAAGVPQAGMMGMSEAMAPASVESGGIGSMMPKTMKMGGEVESYAEGGLIEGIADSVSQNTEALQGIQAATLQNSKLLQDQQNQAAQQAQINRPMTIQQPLPMPAQNIRPRLPGFGGKGGPRRRQRPFELFNRMPMNRFGVPSQQRLGTMAARLGTGGLGFGQYASRAFGIPEPQSMAEGGVIRAQTGLSIADRNQNPGNMRLTNDPYFGTTGKASGYATFASPEFGLRGIALTSDKYAEEGIKTLKDFVEKYSPASDNNPNNKQYAKVLADSLGVDVDDEIDFSDDNVKRNLIPAITRFEGYKGPIDSNMVDRAISASKVKEDEGKVNELLSGVDTLSPTDNQKIVEFSDAPLKSGIMSAVAGTLDDDDEKELNAAQKRAAKRGGGAGGPKSILDIFKPTTVTSGPTGQMKRVDPNLFNIDEKRKELPKTLLEEEMQKRRPNKEKLAELKKTFPFDLEKEDIYSEGNLELPTDEESRKFFTDRGINPDAKTEPKGDDEPKTQLTTLEQELLNRQNQLQKDRDFDRYMALAQAGLAIMSSDKPTLAGAIGEGGTAGLTAFREAQERYQEGLTDILNARVKLASKKSGLTQKEAISAISNIDSTIAKLDENLTKTFDEEKKNQILARIAQLNFQKRGLMGTAGFDYLPVNVSDSAAAKS